MGSLEIRPVHSTGDLRRFIRLPVPALPRRAELGRAADLRAQAVPEPAQEPVLRARPRRVLPRAARRAAGRPHHRAGRRQLPVASRTTAGAGSASSSARTTRRRPQALLDRAEQWLRGQGCDRMVGPADFTTNDECGVLLEGHDRTPLILSPWTHRYYPGLMEGAGMAKAMDLLMWELRHLRPRQGQPDHLEARRPGRAAPRRHGAAVPQEGHRGRDLALHGGLQLGLGEELGLRAADGARGAPLREARSSRSSTRTGPTWPRRTARPSARR